MMGSCSSPLLSPSSDKRFWSTLRSRIDTLLDARQSETSTHSPTVSVLRYYLVQSIFFFPFNFELIRQDFRLIT